MNLMQFNSFPQSLYQVWEKESRPLDFMDWKTAVEYSYLKVASAPQPHVISHYVDDFGKVKCVALQSTSLSNYIIFLLKGVDGTYL